MHFRSSIDINLDPCQLYCDSVLTLVCVCVRACVRACVCVCAGSLAAIDFAIFVLFVCSLGTFCFLNKIMVDCCRSTRMCQKMQQHCWNQQTLVWSSNW